METLREALKRMEEAGRLVKVSGVHEEWVTGTEAIEAIEAFGDQGRALLDETAISTVTGGSGTVHTTLGGLRQQQVLDVEQWGVTMGKAHSTAGRTR